MEHSHLIIDNLWNDRFSKILVFEISWRQKVNQNILKLRSTQIP